MGTRHVQASSNLSLVAAEYVQAWDSFYCYFDCPDFVFLKPEELEGTTFNLAIAAGSVIPQAAPYLGPCIAPRASPAPPASAHGAAHVTF